MIEKNMLGKFIRIKRENAGLSQKQFAEQLFVTESAVSKWERGVNYPDITMISDICRVLDVSERELITASEDTSYRRIKKQVLQYEKAEKAVFLDTDFSIPFDYLDMFRMLFDGRYACVNVVDRSCKPCLRIFILPVGHKVC